MKFKEGDKVVFVKDTHIGKWPYRERDIPIGSVGKVWLIAERAIEDNVSIDVDFEVEASRTKYWFNEDELELLEGCFIDRVKPKGKKRG